ncbi:MAG: histidine kinase [Sphingobacteriaceae bacterium]|nr:histidine kinase [Cytophagaceae bacterium]
MIVTIPFAWLIVWSLRRFLNTPTRLPRWDRLFKWSWLLGIPFVAADLLFKLPSDNLDEWYLFVVFGLGVVMALLVVDYRPARTFLLAAAPFCLIFLVSLALELVAPRLMKEYDTAIGVSWVFAFIWLVTFIIIARNQKKTLEKERLRREEEGRIKAAIEAQNALLEGIVVTRTAELTQQKEALELALANLKTTQAQLIQSERLASLGELTAGIAHEIQNPLNFVNNFSEVNAELCGELSEAIEALSVAPDEKADLLDLLNDLILNQQKITHHGRRADSIVKGMLQHSRSSTGQKEPTDPNALADEYLRLAYHGLRAKDKTFNATLDTHFDPNLGLVSLVPQELGRALLNLFTNAFYAVQQRQQQTGAGYQPTVSVHTLRANGQVEIRVADNGTGMPEAVKQKIFQPFFTTKPSGQGTGLGLSLTYDIVTKGHGGTLVVESVEGKGTTFVVRLPV